MMPILYATQFFLVALALAAIAQSMLKNAGAAAVPWALLWITATPHVLSALVLIIAWLWPEAPRAVFLVLPGALAAAVLLALRHSLRQLADSVSVQIRRAWRDFNGPVLVIGLLAAFLVIRLLIAAIDAPVTGQDALTYMTEARVFAERRTIAAIPGFDAGVGEIVKTHPHRFLWQAYIAQALMASTGAIGFDHDLVARVAMILTMPLLIAAVFALACIVATGWTVLLSVPLALLITQIGYIPSATSVDAFRIIPFVAVVAVLLVVVERGKRISPALVISTIFFTAMAAFAHTINLAFLAILFASLFLLPLLGLTSWLNLFSLWASALVAVAPSLVYYFQNWRQYGDPFGLGFDYYFYRDTPIWEKFAQLREWTKSSNPLWALTYYLRSHGLVMTIAACMAAVAFALTRMRKDPALSALAIMFLALLVVPLVPLGSDVTLQGAMLSNVRYGLLVIVLVPAILASAVGILEREWSPWARALTFSRVSGRTIVALVLSAAGVYAILGWNLESRSSAMRFLDQSELFVAGLAKDLPTGSNWAIDRYSTAYFADRPPIKLTSAVARPLLKAQNDEEAREALDELRIRMVAVYTVDWWNQTAVFHAVSTSKSAEKFTSNYWQVFVLRPDASGWASSDANASVDRVDTTSLLRYERHQSGEEQQQ